LGPTCRNHEQGTAKIPKGRRPSFEELVQTMNLWFEHDSSDENKFSHIVPVDEMKRFFLDVVARSRKRR
jgi:hypothetical protein